MEVILENNLENIEIRYTTDGAAPTSDSPLFQDNIVLEETTTVSCQVYREGEAISGVARRTFTKVVPREAEKNIDTKTGLDYSYFHGEWVKIPDFDSLEPEKTGNISSFNTSPTERKEHFGFCFTGFISVPEDGVYKFFVSSDDGSRLYIGDKWVVDNDGAHSSKQVSGRIALEAGLHTIKAEYFQRGGGQEFGVYYSGPGIEKQEIPSNILFSVK
jgi:hypothetical protein